MKVSFTPDSDLVQFMFDELQLDLAHQHLENDRQWFCVVVRNDHDAVIAGLVCEFWSTFDCHFSAAIADPAAITPKLLAVIFQSLFLRVKRITALADPDNQESIDRLGRLGFVYEGFKRLGLDGQKDALMFGMIESDCRFLPGVRATPITETGGPDDGIPTKVT